MKKRKPFSSEKQRSLSKDKKKNWISLLIFLHLFILYKLRW